VSNSNKKETIWFAVDIEFSSAYNIDTDGVEIHEVFVFDSTERTFLCEAMPSRHLVLAYKYIMARRELTSEESEALDGIENIHDDEIDQYMHASRVDRYPKVEIGRGIDADEAVRIAVDTVPFS